VSEVSRDPDVGRGQVPAVAFKKVTSSTRFGAASDAVGLGLAPMNVSEKTMARRLIPTLPGGGYLLGEAEYDATLIYLAAEAGFQLVAKKRRDRGRGGLGHRRQSPGRLRSIELLETKFGESCSINAMASNAFRDADGDGRGLAPLPAWVRHFNRVRIGYKPNRCCRRAGG